jgi:hypothetical protein
MKTIHQELKHGNTKYESKYNKKYESKYTKSKETGKVGTSAKTMFFDAKKNVGKISSVNFDKIEQKISVGNAAERVGSGNINLIPISHQQAKFDKSTTDNFAGQEHSIEENTVPLLPKTKISADLFKKK